MKKSEMKDLLFDILNENDEMFSDISLDDRRDALVVHTLDGEQFVLSLDHLENEDIIRSWAGRKPVSLSVGISLVQMEEVGIISEEDLNKYFIEVSKKADELQQRFGCWTG